MSAVYLCVDGGGTSTRARLYDATGATLLGSARAGPCNVSTDPVSAAAHVAEVWEGCARAAGLDPRAPGVARATIGAAGTLPPRTREEFERRLPAFSGSILVTDGYAALVAAGEGRPSGLLIAGTGAVAHRLLADGRSIRRDGWGWAAGDRGSGFWIGRQVLRHVLAVVEGLSPPSNLSRRLYADRQDLDALLELLAGIGPTRIAAFAPEAIAAADEGCPVAAGILRRAVDHLAALAGLLELPSDLPLYMLGGLTGALRPAIERRLGRRIDTTSADAVDGCRLIATGQVPAERMTPVGFPEPSPAPDAPFADRPGE